jgi:hypothetical protein
VSEGDSNFFSRWSRRKAEVRVGTVTPESAALAPAAAASGVAEALPVPATPLPPPAAAPPAPPAPPPPTLADVDALTTKSDYTRFVSRDVAPEVKQAALKKLFTDPHFNVMDGLDTYIDDYGKPDPLPPGMLRKMMQSQLLGLFDHEKKIEGADAPAGEADAPAPAADTAPAPPADTAAPDAGEEPATNGAPPTIPTPPEP